MLNVVVARLEAAGLSERIKDAQCESATALVSIPTASCDVVLLLGPLYHLCTAVDRLRAVAEAARILRPAGVVFAAGINRIALLRDAFRAESTYTAARQAFHVQFLLDGNVDPLHVPPLGYAHLTTSTEFRALFADSFGELVFTGVESFTGVWQSLLATAHAPSANAWLDLVEQTALTPEGIGMSDHFLYIGRRR
jgi:SAM-dependent methyltransferase